MGGASGPLSPSRFGRKSDSREPLGSSSSICRPAAEALCDPLLSGQWREVCDRLAGEPNLLYATPEWTNRTLAGSANADSKLLEIRAVNGLVGVCPVSIQTYDLLFDVANHVLAKFRFPAATVWGAEFMLPSGLDGLQVLETILDSERKCQAIYLPTIPTDSTLFKTLTAVGASRFLCYLPYGIRPWHHLQIDGDFNDYLSRMGTKTRGTLRRKVRKLQESTAGKFAFRRLSSPHEVPELIKSVSQISQATWQNRLLGLRIDNDPDTIAGYTEMARQGLLRAYLIELGNRPCAFLIGYQYRGVYYYEETGFDEAFTELSPGTAVLFLAIEDLFAFDRPRSINFGIGDGVHKRRFANLERQDAAVLLFRRNLSNRVRRSAHGGFQFALNAAKRLLGRKVEK